MISEVRNSLWKYPVALLAGGFIFFRRLWLSFNGESATEEDGVLNITPLQGLILMDELLIFYFLHYVTQRYKNKIDSVVQYHSNTRAEQQVSVECIHRIIFSNDSNCSRGW